MRGGGRRGGGEGVGAARDFQANSITSPPNGITLPASGLLTSRKKERDGAREPGPRKERGGGDREVETLYSGSRESLKRFTSVSSDRSHQVWFTPEHREMRLWRKDGTRDRRKQIKMSNQLPFTQEHVHERGKKKKKD